MADQKILDANGSEQVSVPTVNASAIVGVVAANQGGTGDDTSASTGDPVIDAGVWTVNTRTGTGNSVHATAPTVSSPVINTGVSGTAIDNDATFASPSSTKIPTTNAVKGYVDQTVLGLSAKADVRLATAAALATNTYSNGSSGVGATLTAVGTGVLTVDGVTVALNDRILVKNEVAGANNGIYKCTLAGAIGVAYILTRATDGDTDAELRGSWMFSQEGTANAGQGWLNTNTSAITFGTTAITFGEFSAGATAAGTGLNKSGNTLNLADTAVTPASYTAVSLTVDQQGRITAASSGATTGSGSLVRATSPSLTTPAIAGATLTGAVDANAATLRAPVSASVVSNTEGNVQWNSTDKAPEWNDGTRSRFYSLGYGPIITLPGHSNQNTYGGAITLAANGGTLIVPFWSPGNCLLDNLLIRNNDTASARSWTWAIYVDINNATNAIARWCAASGSDAFTAAAASNRQLTVGSAPVYLPQGWFYLAIQNNHASNTFALSAGGYAGTASPAPTLGRTKTLTPGLGTTLDIIAATWTVQTAVAQGFMFGDYANSTAWM